MAVSAPVETPKIDPRMSVSSDEEAFLQTQRMSFLFTLTGMIAGIGGFVLVALMLRWNDYLEVAWLFAGGVYLWFAIMDQLEKAGRFLEMDDGEGTLFHGRNHALEWWLWGLVFLVRESHTLVVRRVVDSTTGPTDFLQMKGRHLASWKLLKGFGEFRESLGIMIPLWHKIVEVGPLRNIDPDYDPVEARTVDGQTVGLDLRSPVSMMNPIVFTARTSGMTLEEKLQTLDTLVRKRIQDAVTALGSQMSIDTFVGIPFPEVVNALRGRRAPSLSYRVAFERFAAQMRELGVPNDGNTRWEFQEDGPLPSSPLSVKSEFADSFVRDDYGWSHSTALRRILRVELGYPRKTDTKFDERKYTVDDIKATPAHIIPDGFLVGLNDELLLLAGVMIPLTRFKLQFMLLPDGIIRAAEDRTIQDMSRRAAASAGQALREFAAEAGIPAQWVLAGQAYSLSQSGRGLFEAPQGAGGQRQERTSGGRRQGSSSPGNSPRRSGGNRGRRQPEPTPPAEPREE